MSFSRTIQFCALAGLVGGFSLSALAEDQPANDKSLGAMFERLDADKDGQLTKEEVGESRVRFFDRLVRVADKNNDGKLTKEEFVAGNQPAERPAQPGNPFGGNRPRFGQSAEEGFKRLDQNGDGKLTVDEAPEPLKQFVRGMLRRAGKGEDAAITLEEFKQAGVGMRPMGQMAAGGGFGGGAFLRAVDTDRDGKLSKAELAKAVDQFDKLDKNGDGNLDARELSGFEGTPEGRTPFGPGGQRPNGEQFVNGLMERYDADKDGKLSEKELADLPERIKARISAWDANKDGTVSKEEITAAMKKAALDRAPQDSTRPNRPKTDK